MFAILHQHTDPGAPGIESGGNLFAVLTFCLEAHGWQVTAYDDEESRPTLEITPASGGAATLRLTRVTDGYSDEISIFRPRVFNMFAEDNLPLQTLPEIQAKVIANLEAGDEWATGLTREELVAVFAERNGASQLPALPNTPFAKLSPAIRAKILDNFAQQKNWWDGISDAELMSSMSAFGLTTSVLLNMMNSLPTALVNKMMANYYSGRSWLYGLTSSEIGTLIGAAGITFTEADTVIELVGGEALMAQLSADDQAQINSNILAGDPWHTGLDAAGVRAVIDAAAITFTLSDFPAPGLFEGIEELYFYGELGHDRWAVMADEKSFFFLIGRVPMPGEDYETPDLAVARYYVALGYGTIINPLAEPGFLLVNNEYYSGSLEDFYSPQGMRNNGYGISLLPRLLDSYDAGSGRPIWGEPPLPGAPLVCPYQVFRTRYLYAGEENPPPMTLGLLPFLEMAMSWMNPAQYPSGAYIAQNRYLFHTPNGSIILRATDPPLTSKA
ncbi:MAG: hypothetical protein LBQ81_09930 [Zoogloeaceae bacterium]|jgi:hypothetical protein|nr:hypothetical protein [Zoogloeaceae bacterium]